MYFSPWDLHPFLSTAEQGQPMREGVACVTTYTNILQDQVVILKNANMDFSLYHSSTLK